MNETTSNDSPIASNQSYTDASPLNNQSSLAAHFHAGHAGPSFSVLAAEHQEQIIAHVLAMPAQEQTDYLARMQQMDAEEMLASARPPETSGDAQQKHYTVRQGDSLSKIARAHDVSLSKLIQANPQIRNPDLIHPDQVIAIPAV